MQNNYSIIEPIPGTAPILRPKLDPKIRDFFDIILNAEMSVTLLNYSIPSISQFRSLSIKG